MTKDIMEEFRKKWPDSYAIPDNIDKLLESALAKAKEEGREEGQSTIEITSYQPAIDRIRTEERNRIIEIARGMKENHDFIEKSVNETIESLIKEIEK